MSERSTERSRPRGAAPGLRPVACAAGALVSVAVTTALGAVAVAVLLGAPATTSPGPDPVAWLAGLVPLVLLIGSFGGGVVAGGAAGASAPDHGIAAWAMTGVAGVALVLVAGFADPAPAGLGRIRFPSLEHQPMLVEVVALLGVVLSLAGSITGATVGVAIARRAVRTPNAAPPPGPRSVRRR